MSPRFPQRLAVALVPVAILATSACGGGADSSSAKDRPPVEHKIKPPVRVQPPEAPDDAAAYEAAAMVVWIGTDGIAVTDSLEPSSNEKSIVTLTGGRRMGANTSANPHLIPELFDAVTPRVEAVRKSRETSGEPDTPIVAAWVADRRINAETLLAVQYTLGMAEVSRFRLVLDHGKDPQAIDISNPQFGIAGVVEAELRPTGSSLVIRYSGERHVLMLSPDVCLFDKAEATGDAVTKICEQYDQSVDLTARLNASTNFGDLVRFLSHDPRPKGCSGRWIVDVPHEEDTPNCEDAVEPEQILEPGMGKPLEAMRADELLPADGEPIALGQLGFIGNPDRDNDIGDVVEIDGGIGLGGTEPESETRVTTPIVTNGDQLAESTVARTFRAKRSALAVCAEEAGLSRGTTLQFKIKIGTTGKVIFAFTKDDAGHADAATCMTKALKQWTFPEPEQVHEVVFDLKVW